MKIGVIATYMKEILVFNNSCNIMKHNYVDFHIVHKKDSRKYELI